jgi:hypothetical protein
MSFYLVAKTTDPATGEPTTVVLTLDSTSRVAAIKEAESNHGCVAAKYRQSWTVSQAETPETAQFLSYK